MIVALEGLDRLGKSCLAELVSEMFVPKLEIVKVVTSKNSDGLISLKKDCFEFGFNMPDFFEDLVIIETLFQIKASGIILDRTIVSADVYRLNPFSESIWNFWLNRFTALQGIYIWVDSEYDFYLERLQALGEVDNRQMTESLWDKRRGEFSKYFQNIAFRTKGRTLLVQNDVDVTLDELAIEICEFISKNYAPEGLKGAVPT